MAKTEAKPRPVPKPTPTTQAFWDGAKKGKLMLQWDPMKRKYQFWPRANSVHTGRRNLQWKAATGKGELYSFTITHVPVPGFESKAPYVIGMIELDEGVRIIGNMVNVQPEEIEIGMRVKVAWEKINDDITYFAFEPDRRGKRPNKRK
ncbi:MAG: OB-fold domain-containing protein [Pseudomonadota bacterium]|nr:OB-fold domain-containing protein [Pseudomonadota bacterium]|tara:strand:- start:211 stop:654 length:444 start_codon:yes stop_codon:yes gene_type:complete